MKRLSEFFREGTSVPVRMSNADVLNRIMRLEDALHAMQAERAKIKEGLRLSVEILQEVIRSAHLLIGKNDLSTKETDNGEQ